jgi:hypothetical protein
MSEDMMFYGTMTAHWSVIHWILFTLGVALTLYPVGRILRRLGYSPFWSVLALVPPLILIGLWTLAMAEWPRERRDQSSSTH